MNILGYTYEGGFHCPHHAALRFTPGQLAGDPPVYCTDGTSPRPVFDVDEWIEYNPETDREEHTVPQCEDCIYEQVASR